MVETVLEHEHDMEHTIVIPAGTGMYIQTHVYETKHNI
jgi:hypothetical protein